MTAAQNDEKDTNGKAQPKSAPGKPSLTSITLQGFKSFRDETRIEIRPLTLLAGANSSGKSSAIQPLLLLKQTLEATYDPGALLLDGPNVSFTKLDQLLWRGADAADRSEAFSVGLSDGDGDTVRLFFRGAERGGVEVEKLAYVGSDGSYELRPDMPGTDLRELVIAVLGEHFSRDDLGELSFRVDRERGSLVAVAMRGDSKRGNMHDMVDPFEIVHPVIQGLIHLPGLRGNPERYYPTAKVSAAYPGLFQKYVASVILSWKEAGDGRIERLDKAVSHLGLTSKVDARRLDDTNIEIRVGRLPHKNGSNDLVNIADVGFGVSQTLPVVVALLAAAPGQVVYLEQPEIHLHPRAQVALASLLLDATKRGVVVIAETHSDLLLRSVLRGVAAGEADPSLVALHWFERDKDGATKVTTGKLDAAGTYGDWPVDFDDVDLKLESAFLDASLRHPT
jgi:hypothetical protein